MRILWIYRTTLLEEPRLVISPLIRITLSIVTALWVFATLAQAQGWPTRPIRLIVPFPPGSATDSLARVVAKDLTEALNQQVIVDNRPGAGGNIASEMVARSAPNGYTLMLGTNSQFAANVSLYKKLPYNPITDFEPIVRLATQPSVLLVRDDFPARNLAEFVTYVRSRPDKLSAGYGASSPHVALAKLRNVAKLDFIAVPYKGIPQAVIDVLGGTVDFTVADLGTAIAQAKGRKARAIAITSAERSSLVPDWPAISETYPGFDTFGWYAIVAPAGTSIEIVQKVYEICVTSLTKPDFKAALATFGMTAAPMNREALAAFIKSDIPRWAQLFKEAGVEPE